MKVVVTHTDLRIYWFARLEALRRQAETLGWMLRVIEIAGRGSPYSFAGSNTQGSGGWWSCIFPNDRMEDVPSALASERLYQALDRENPDVVVAGAIAFPSGATAVRWAKERGKRVIIFDDARQSDVIRSKLVNWIKRRIYANVDAVLVPAPSHLPDFQACGFSQNQIFYGVDVVDNAFFATRAKKAQLTADNIRQSLGLPGKFLLGIGRQIPKKNWHGLLDAWLQFSSQQIDSSLALVLIGNGPERERLEEWVKVNTVHRVVFFDFVDSDTLAQFYALAQGAVLPSLFGETWGLVVNEAMASGLPVLVSKECGCAEVLVNDGVNGWVFDPYDITALADCIRKLDELAPERRDEMGEASQQLISDWGLDRFVGGMVAAINYVTKTPKRRTRYVDRLILKIWKGRYRPL